MAIVGNAYVVVHANTTNFQRELRDAVRGAQGPIARDSDVLGQTVARGMQRGTSSFSSFEREARAANDAFFTMVTTGYALGPAISGVVGAISSLVSSFFALGSQIAAALPSLIVLPSVFAAIAQGALTLKLAFGGIGKALGAMGKSAGGGGKDTAAALRRVEDAERNLALVIERNRETLVRAAKAVADAEDNLTEARKRASESLQQLNFDAEDAAISEQRAAIELEKARETLMRVQDLPPNNTARREAELAFAEADLNYRRAVDRNKDLAKETEDANKKGVEGSDEVVDASTRLKEAKDDQARAERDALRAQEDAIRALEDAKRALNEGAGAAGGMNDAMKDLSKEAQDFVKYLFSLKGALKGLRAEAGKDLFPKLMLAIQNLVDNLLPVLGPILRRTGSAIGDAAITLSRFITEGENLASFQRIASNNEITIRRFGKATGNLYTVLLDLLDAARPLTNRFTKWITALTGGWKESIRTRKETGSLRDIFKKAGDTAAQLGRIFKNIGKALFGIGKEASGPGSGGQKLLDAFEGATRKFKKFVKEVSKDGNLKQFFIDAAKNTIKIGQLLVKVVEWFLKLGDNKGVGKFADTLKPAVENIGLMFDRLTSGGPALGKFVTKLTELILVFTETGSIKTFFGILTNAVDKLVAFFSNPKVMQILMIAAPIIGAIKAFTLMGKVGGFAFKVIAGYGFKLAEIFKVIFGGIIKVLKIARVLALAFGVSTGSVLLVAAGVVAVIASLVMAYKKSEKFREAIGKVVTLVKDTLFKAFNEIKGVIEEVFGGKGKASAEGFTDIFKTLGDVLSYVVPIIGDALVSAINLFTAGIKSALYIIGAFVNVIRAIVKIVQAIIALFQGDWKKAGQLFGDAWKAIKAAVGLAVKGIIVWLKGLWAYFKKIPQLMWKAMQLAWKLIVGIVKGAIRMVVALIKVLPKLAGKFFVFLWDKFKDLVKALVPWFKDRMSDLVDIIKSLPGRFWSFLKSVWDKFKDGVVALKNWFGDRISDIVQFMKDLPGRFASAIVTLWNSYRDGVQAVKSWFADRISDIVQFMKDLPGRFANAIVNLWNSFRDGVTALKTWFGERITEIVGFVTGIPGRIATVASTLWDGIKNSFSTVKDTIKGWIDEIIGFVKNIPTRLAELAGSLLEGAKGIGSAILDGIVSGLKGAASASLDFAKSLGDAVLGAFKTAWNGFVDFLNNATPNKIDIPGPFDINLPDNPWSFLKLAKGGIVKPTSGGTMALIGEAGRPERVEPLDPNGLSKRDKAMIKMMAPGAGGVTVNVYPSAGMDERALAEMVSRRLAKDMRIGAA